MILVSKGMVSEESLQSLQGLRQPLRQASLQCFGVGRDHMIVEES